MIVNRTSIPAQGNAVPNTSKYRGMPRPDLSSKRIVALEMRPYTRGVAGYKINPELILLTRRCEA